MSSHSNFTNILEFMKLIGHLKHLKRTGWVKRNISEPESVAGHMYRMGVMSMLFNDQNNTIDTNKVMQMSLVHDMAESIVGDITPHCGVGDSEKHSREVKAMEHIKTLVGEHHGQHFMDLFMEYEEQKTAESHLVKDLDKIDMVLQAFEYEQRDNKPQHLQEFFNSVEGKLKHPVVVHWFESLKAKRKSPLNEATITSSEDTPALP